MAGQSADDILSGVKSEAQEIDAKERLANQASPTPVPEGLKSPSHEYSNASYKMAHKYSLADEAKSAGEGIKARTEMTKKALQ